MKNDPCRASASCAFSRPELEETSAVPSVPTFKRSASGGPTLSPFDWVQLPPWQVSRMPTRIRAPRCSTRLRRSATLIGSPWGKSDCPSECPE